MSARHIRKNDIVAVAVGASAGKTGKVLDVLTSKGRAIVEGINLVKKAMRKTQENPKGGILEKEASIAISNLLLFCPACKKGVKIGRAVEAEKTVRKCRKCGHIFDK